MVFVAIFVIFFTIFINFIPRKKTQYHTIDDKVLFAGVAVDNACPVNLRRGGNERKKLHAWGRTSPQRRVYRFMLLLVFLNARAAPQRHRTLKIRKCASSLIEAHITSVLFINWSIPTHRSSSFLMSKVISHVLVIIFIGPLFSKF